MEIKNILREIGLTDGEAKVYLALLKLGLSSKTQIINESNVSSSKIYFILDRLMDKGLVSVVVRNNAKNYAAAPASRIKEYLGSRIRAIEEQQTEVEKIIGKFEAMQDKFNSLIKVEMFIGWKGMETAYSNIIEKMLPQDMAYILGASEGKNPELTKNFFAKYSQIVKQRGIKVKIIFNEVSRKYTNELEQETGIQFNKRFLFKSSPVEVAISSQGVAIVILREEPIVILIHDKETAESFVTYFNELWKIAKE